MYCTEFELRQAEFNELKNILRKEFIDEKVKEKITK